MDNEAKQIKARERAKQWAIDNPERYKARQKAWRELNAEKKKAYGQEYREKNKEKIAKQKRLARARAVPRVLTPEQAQKARDRAKRWRKENPEPYLAQMAHWRSKNPDRAKEISDAGSHNRRARVKAAGGKISADDAKKVRSARKCAACGKSHRWMEIDHKIPLSKGGTNHLSNLQLLCRPCNRSKHAKDEIAWAQENGRLL